MAKELIAVLRRGFPELRRLPFYTAIELAHRADASGSVHISYQFLADRVRVHKRTAQRHIAQLLELGLIRKITCRLSAALRPGGRPMFACNRYIFLIHWRRNTAHAYPDDKTVSASILTGKTPRILPDTNTEKEKYFSLERELTGIKRFAVFLTPGGMAAEAAQAEIARLEALQRQEV